MEAKRKPVGVTTKYTGHQPAAIKASISEHVSGEMAAFVADPRQTKFRRSAVQIVHHNPYSTNTGLAQKTVKAKDYRDRTAPVRAKEHNNNPAKSFSAKTSASADFVNFQKQITSFAKEDPADYRSIFTSMDTDGSGALDKSELRAALHAKNVDSDYITNTLMAHFDKNSDGKVTWEEFAAGLAAAKAQLVGSVNLKQVSGKTKPSWELKKGKEVRRRLGCF